MKTLLALTLTLCLAVSGYSQKYRSIDKSPVDISYYPDYFAHDRKEGDEIVARVIYSRPQKKDREVFGGIVSYGKVWRTGANESTEIQFYKDVELAGKSVPAGTYSLFTIPEKDEWTIIINKNILYWGAYSYDEKQDVARVTVPSSSLDEPLEAFTITFSGEGNDFTMYLAWDKTKVEVPLQY